MSKTFAKAFILGYADDAPEFTVPRTGRAYARFTLNTFNRQPDCGSGEYREVAQKHHVVAFEKYAELVRDRLRKGDLIVIQGRIAVPNWNARDTGEMQSRTEIVLDDISFTGVPGPEALKAMAESAARTQERVPNIDEVF